MNLPWMSEGQRELRKNLTTKQTGCSIRPCDPKKLKDQAVSAGLKTPSSVFSGSQRVRLDLFSCLTPAQGIVPRQTAPPKAHRTVRPHGTGAPDANNDHRAAIL